MALQMKRVYVLVIGHQSYYVFFTLYLLCKQTGTKIKCSNH